MRSARGNFFACCLPKSQRIDATPLVFKLYILRESEGTRAFSDGNDNRRKVTRDFCKHHVCVAAHGRQFDYALRAEFAAKLKNSARFGVGNRANFGAERMRFER